MKKKDKVEETLGLIEKLLISRIQFIFKEMNHEITKKEANNVLAKVGLKAFIKQ